MPRLYRPHVPLSVRCAVAERQVRLAAKSPIAGFDASCFERFLCDVPAKPFGRRLAALLKMLAAIGGYGVSDLRLDHDPPLGARPRRRSGLGRKTYYTPDANDPDHLFYRPHGPEHAGSHLVKTNVRGDHGQHPDRVLIKKARRRERSRNGETRRKASGFPKGPSQLKRATVSGVKLRGPKRKWAKRPFPNRRKP